MTAPIPYPVHSQSLTSCRWVFWLRGALGYRRGGRGEGENEMGTTEDLVQAAISAGLDFL